MADIMMKNGMQNIEVGDLIVGDLTLKEIIDIPQFSNDLYVTNDVRNNEIVWIVAGFLLEGDYVGVKKYDLIVTPCRCSIIDYKLIKPWLHWTEKDIDDRFPNMNSSNYYYVPGKIFSKINEKAKFPFLVKSCSKCSDRLATHIVDGHALCDECYAEHTLECHGCGERHLLSKKVVVNGWNYCRNCADIKYPICYECNRRHAVANTTRLDDKPSGRAICKRCLNLFYDKCQICGKIERRTQLFEAPDTHIRICGTCFNEAYEPCYRCGIFHRKENMNLRTFSIGPNRICDSCLPYYTECKECGLIISKKLLHVDKETGDYYCDSCFDKLNPNCSYCGTRIGFNILSKHGSDDSALCDKCYEGAEHGMNECKCGSNGWKIERSGVTNYYYKPIPVLFPRKDCDNKHLYYGIELEVDSVHYYPKEKVANVADRINDMMGYTYTKHDGSLSIRGFEIVTHPATPEYHLSTMREKWISLMEYLRRNGYSSHSVETCGLHIHVSAFPIMYDTENGVEKLLYLWDKHWINIMKCSRRKSMKANEWARRLVTTIPQHSDSKTAIDALTKTKEDAKSSRYNAINLTNKNTIEFRLMRGTLRPIAFFAAIQLISTIVDIVMEKTFDELREMTWEEIISYHDNAELKAYWDERKDYVICCNLEKDKDDEPIIADTFVA